MRLNYWIYIHVNDINIIINYWWIDEDYIHIFLLKIFKINIPFKYIWYNKNTLINNNSNQYTITIIVYVHHPNISQNISQNISPIHFIQYVSAQIFANIDIHAKLHIVTNWKYTQLYISISVSIYLSILIIYSLYSVKYL